MNKIDAKSFAWSHSLAHSLFCNTTFSPYFMDGQSFSKNFSKVVDLDLGTAYVMWAQGLKVNIHGIDIDDKFGILINRME